MKTRGWNGTKSACADYASASTRLAGAVSDLLFLYPGRTEGHAPAGESGGARGGDGDAERGPRRKCLQYVSFPHPLTLSPQHRRHPSIRLHRGTVPRPTFLSAGDSMHRNVILTAAALSLLGVTGRAQAQPDQWTRQVSALLDQAASTATSNGMRRTHTPYIGSLRENATASHTLQLNAGTSYQLVGVCDNDCSDFDLRLFDPQGRMVAEDVLTDDTPVLSVSPRRTGTYTVRAIMTSCSAEPCRYGIGVYGSGGGFVPGPQGDQGQDQGRGGQDQWTGQVRRLLDQAAEMATRNGMRSIQQPYLGSLRTGATTSHTVQLNAGTAYSLIGVCDNDCSDFDLRLYDPRGREVASDVLTDDTPVLNVTPRFSGTYTVRAIMTACSDQPCRYGIGVYAGGNGGGGRGLSSSGDEGGDEWTQQVANLLNQAASTATSRGLRRTHTPYIGSLRTGAQSSHELQLNAGTSYALIGVCDNDCSDLDLRLFDPNGREVGSDLLTDDTPVVNVTPRRTGTYTVRAIMTACSSQPCRYGIGVYGR